MAKPYKDGDIVAVLLPKESARALGSRKEKAFSCKVRSEGVGETRKGDVINFIDDQVLWVLGPNQNGDILWPKFVLEAFNGRYKPLDVEAEGE